MPWTPIADGVVAVLLIATLVYVRRFSKQMGAIRDSRGEFEKLIADLTRSTDQAAGHLHGFKITADATGSDLQARIDRARSLTAEFSRIGDDLKLLAERAESAANRLEAAIARTRPGTTNITDPRVPSHGGRAQAAPAMEFGDDEDDRKVSSLSALSGLR